MGEIFARRYELLDPIAEGGMGSVWLVRDHVDGDVKAAKLIRHSDAGTLLRFMREQSTRIHHPHVVTPLSWVGEDDTVLFTMPLVRGGSVATLIGDWGALPEHWVAEIVDQTLSALESVHAAGVVHRDVKPANLLLEPTGSERPFVRLTDFGIAAALDQPRLTTAAVALGTPGYVAPEYSAGADPDPRQDLFAVGATGLEMLIGHAPPFAADEIPSSPIAALLARLQEPAPTARPESAAQARDLLRPLLRPTWEPGEVEVLDHFLTGASPSPTVVLPAAPPASRAPSPTPAPPPEAAALDERAPSQLPMAPSSQSASALFPVLLAVLGITLLMLSAWMLTR